MHASSSIARPATTQSSSPNISAVSALKETGKRWLEDNAMRLSAALSLYTILSLAPLLVITIKIVSVVWRNKESARSTATTQLTNLMGSNAADAITQMLNSGAKSGNGVLATVISTAVLLFSAAGVFGELQDSMNTIWGVKPKPNQGIWGFVRNRMLSLGMVFGVAFLLLVSMFISSVLSGMVKYLVGDAAVVAIILDVVASFIVVVMLFAAIFKFLPDVKIEWKEVLLGAVLTGALFIVGKYGLALYFKYGSPTSAFGAAGSLAAVLLWVYYSSFILFFGAEFTKVWSRLHHGNQVIPTENAVKVTEDDRAEKGIPSKERMSAAIEKRPTARKPATYRPAPAYRASRAEVQKGAAVYLLAVSSIAGVLSACYLAGKKRGEQKLRWREIGERVADRKAFNAGKHLKDIIATGSKPGYEPTRWR